MEKDSVSIHFVRAAVRRLESAGRARVLRAAGIAPDLLAADAARVPATAFSALWLAVARESDDEFFGLDTRRMKVGSFALLCRSLIGAGDLERALKQMLAGLRVFLDDVEGELRVAGGEAAVRIHNRIADQEARRFADETFLVMVHGLLCWLGGRRIPLSAAEFAYPRPPHAHEYATMYTEHLAFGAGRDTTIRFDARHLALPVLPQVAQLRTFLRSAPQSVFLKYRNEDSWAARVRRRLRAAAAHADWPVLEDMAQSLHVAPATLRRRLETEGVTYQAIKDALRRDAAIHRLSSTGLTIADIAAEVGFEEPSAFYRAFRKWTGVAPSAYRSSK